MKKLLCLIVCATLLAVGSSFSVSAELPTHADMLPGRLPEIVITSTIPAEFVPKGDLYEVFGVLCESGHEIDVPEMFSFYLTVIRLPSGADTQGDLDAAREVLLANPYVLYADQNSVGTLDKETYALGDVNNDGRVSGVDYALLKRAVIGICELTEAQQTAADINGDGRISGVDYMLLKRAVMGLYVIEQP